MNSKVKRKRLKKKITHNFLRKRWFWILISTIIVSSVVGYLLFFSKYFQLKEIEVLGLERVGKEDIVRITEDVVLKEWKVGPLKLLSTQSIFLINSDLLEDVVMDHFLLVGSVKSRIRVPDKVIVVVEERYSVAEVCHDECYSVDRDGFAFEKTIYSGGAGKEANVFRAQSGELVLDILDGRELSLGKEIISSDDLASSLSIKRGVEDALKEIASMSLEESELIVKVGSGPKIYFSLDRDVNNQMTNLKLLVEKQISEEEIKGLEYIDLRFGNRVYYK